MFYRSFIASVLAGSMAACSSGAVSSSAGFSGNTGVIGGSFPSSAVFKSLTSLTAEQRTSAFKAYRTKTLTDLRQEVLDKVDNAPISVAGVEFYNMHDQLAAARDAASNFDSKYENLGSFMDERKASAATAPGSEESLQANLKAVATSVNGLSLANFVTDTGSDGTDDSSATCGSTGADVSGFASTAVLIAGIITSFFFLPVGVPLMAAGGMGELTTGLTASDCQ